MSKPSDTDKRYDCYADIFKNPETDRSIELGNRVLHWQFMEEYCGRGQIENHAREAQEESLRRVGSDPVRREAEEQRQRDWSPLRHPRKAAARDRSARGRSR